MFLECNIKRFRASEVRRSSRNSEWRSRQQQHQQQQKQSPEVKYNKMLQIPIETTGPPTKINKISTRRVVVSVFGGNGAKAYKGRQAMKAADVLADKAEVYRVLRGISKSIGLRVSDSSLLCCSAFWRCIFPVTAEFSRAHNEGIWRREAKFADVELRGKEQYHFVCFSTDRVGKGIA